MMNTQVYVLDEQQQLAPVGVAGELYLGGAGLARGYLQRPELTAAQFVPHPYSRAGGERLYRTGDQVRWTERGELEFVGRRDEQVKIRGFRVEPGEIEAVLTAHESVREAVVIVRGEESEARRLVAYVVPEAGAALSSSEWRHYLQRRLPDYMVPSAFVRLAQMPLTANGKVDRRALPAPEWSGSGQYVGPRTPVEELLAGIWADVLQVEQVGVYDNFFELGGHSLLATQVMSRVRAVFQIELPLRALFEEPCLEALAARVEQQRSAGQAEAPPISRVNRAQRLRLSFAQQRLWFINQLNPGSAVYNIPVALRLSGRLEVAALEASLTELVKRHESLRTRFVAGDGEPVQVIEAAQPVQLEMQDLSELAEAEREAAAQRLLGAEASKPFELEQGPVLRVGLLKLGAEEHIALLTLHHIVSDGWSMGVLVRELSELYAGQVAGREVELPELPVQYADYAAWQREWLSGAVLEKQLHYWKQQLGGELPVLSLATDYARTALSGQPGGNMGLQLSAETSAGLQELSRREGVTLFMTLLAGWQVLLGRYAGQEEVVVGTPIAGRNRLETEGLIGFFVNTLALRTDLSGDPGFVELLGRVRETTLQAYEHQDVPFEKLVEELQPERDLSRTPLFQVMFALQNAPRQELTLGALRLRQEASENQTAPFELSLTLEESGGIIRGGLNYNRELYEGTTMGRLLRHYEQLLSAIVSGPEARISQLRITTEREERQLLEEWNETEREYPAGSIPQLFEAQAARRPEAVALVFGEQKLSYRELNEGANQLARYLRQLGVGPEVAVGIGLERSAEMVLAWLAVLKAGGAYVPLEVSYPAERLAYMIEDAGLQLVLTQAELKLGITQEVIELPRVTTRLISLERERAEIEKQERTNLEVEVGAENLAYVIYTSGSTGQPKGVAVPQRAVVRLVCNTNYVALDQEVRMAQVSNASFDALTFELWGALLHGGQVVGDQQGRWRCRRKRSPQELRAARHERAVFDDGVVQPVGARACRRRLRSCGMCCLAVKRWSRSGCGPCWRRAGRRALLHVYGPTENTTFSTWEAVQEVAAGARTVPIGKALMNTQVYVLDEQQQLAPVGVAGELYLGGAG